MNDRRLFLNALKLPAGAERAEWLAQACGGDDALREKLTELLRRHEAGEPIPSEWSEAAPLSTVVGAEADANDCGWETMAPDSGSGANSGGSANSNALESLQRLLGQLRQVELRGAGSDAPAGRSASHLSPVPTPGSRYEVLGEIARGGMGVVLKGRDVELGRELAIKILMDRHNDHPDIVQRFVEEAQIGGQLQHPGIAPVYELGQFADHRLFFSMKLVKGETLARLLHDRQNPASERVRFLEIFKQICQTVAYAHSRGVIHRDLKPANVMVGAFGEVQVMDWGLAKVLPTGATVTTGRSPARPTDDGVIQTLRSGSGSDISRASGVSGSQTQMGSVMGTPAYMPPEQALGDVDALDERADVFGLGAILCEILTGQPPYVAEDTMAIHRLAARGATNECSGRLAECGADAELVSLTKQCLEGEPAARPRNAGVLAERITDYLDSVEQRLRAAEVERATESARAEEAVETARMHQAAARAERRARKLQVGLAVGAVVVVAIGGLAASWSAFVQDRLKREAQGAELEAKAARDKERQQRDIAVKARGVAEREEARAKDAMLRAEREATHALQMLADMQTDHGLEAGRNGQSAEAALWFANAALLTPLDPQRQLANHRRAQGWLDRATKFAAVFTRPDEPFQEVRFQPAGRLALILSEQRLHVWDWRAGVALDWPEALSDVAGAAWAPDGQSLAISFQSGDVRVVEPGSGAVKHQFQGAESAKLLVWSPDGGRLALAGDQVQVWRVTDKPERELVLRHPRRVYGVSFNRAGTRLITGCEDDLARVFSMAPGANDSPLFAPLEHAPQHKSQSSAPSFCDDDRRIATVSKKKLPALWDASTGALASPSWRFPSYTVDRCMAVDPRGTWIAVGAGRACMLLGIDGRSFELPHPNSVDFVQFCPDGRSLLTTCYDGFARQWSLDDVDRSLSVWSTPIKTPQNSTFANGAYSDDGRHFALFKDGHVGVWERGRVTHATGSVPWKGSSFLPRASADGRLVAPGARHSFTGTWTAEGDELIVVRSDDGQPAGPAIKLTGFLYDSCVCSDNRSAAAVTIAGNHSWLTVYDIESGEPRYPALELPAQPMSVAARPGIDEIAVLSRNGSLQVLDSRTSERKFEVQHEDWQDRDASHCRAVYSPDGQILVSVDFKSRVFVRDPQTGVARYRPLETVIAEGACRDVAFSRDSRRLATAAVGKNVVRVWDLATGEQAGQDLPHPGDIFGIWTVCFSPDGRHVMTAHKDGLLRIWDWMSGQLVDASMQNPDEVTDASYTADGQHIVAAVRLSAVHVWDVATRRLALPVVDDLFMPGDSAECVRIVGDRAVVTKGYKYYVLDMEKVLRVPHESLESLLRRAELATSTRLRGSDLMRLTPADWTERWEQELASRSAPAVREQPSHPARSGESPQESQ